VGRTSEFDLCRILRANRRTTAEREQSKQKSLLDLHGHRGRWLTSGGRHSTTADSNVELEIFAELWIRGTESNYGVAAISCRYSTNDRTAPSIGFLESTT
jgi:hypothetical protein